MRKISIQGWRKIGSDDIYFRSKWEANYGRFLHYLKGKGFIKEWFHEPQTFWFEGIKRGCVSYLPDFKVINNQGDHYWVEVKGFMDSKSATKIKRFKKYYPSEKLVVIDKSWYNVQRKILPLIIKDWEK